MESAGDTSQGTRALKLKPRAPRNNAKRSNKNQKKRARVTPPLSDSAAGHFCYALEVGSASVWEYLTPSDVASLFQVCSNGLSEEFIDAIALKAIDQFAAENNTHLGWQCKCDWIRSLDFVRHSKCYREEPYGVNKTISVLQSPRGAHNLLCALVLTKKLRQLLCSQNQADVESFVPVVCPLVIERNPSVFSKARIIRALNNTYPGAGSRFFYKFKSRKRRQRLDSLVDHWDGINNSSCQYCSNLVCGLDNTDKVWTSYTIQRARLHCKKQYQPLKAVMEKNLQFVRILPKMRCSRPLWNHSLRYGVVVAGISGGGVLCGLYSLDDFHPAS